MIVFDILLQEDKVFSVYGYFPAIRQALKKRGWVEKVLHQTPYVNPHPSNCVCFQANCTSAFQSHGAPTHRESQESHESPHQVSKPAVVNSKRTCNFIKKNRDLCKSTNSKNVSPTKFINKNTQSDNENSADLLAELPIRDEQPEHDYEKNQYSEDELQNFEQVQDISEEFKELKEEEKTVNLNRKPSYSFNPSILCPEEIRNGIENCINEKKFTIYQYTIPVYEKPLTSLRSESCDDQCLEGTQAIENQEQISDSLEGEEEESNHLVEEEKVEEEKEYEEKISDLTNHNEFDPYNPYPDLEFNIGEIDTSLVGRLLKNVEPNFIWTWTKDSISYKHLTKDQMVNRFPNTPFTTKVNDNY